MTQKIEDNGIYSLTPDNGKLLAINGDTNTLFEKVYIGDIKNKDYIISLYIEVDKPEPVETEGLE